MDANEVNDYHKYGAETFIAYSSFWKRFAPKRN